MPPLSQLPAIDQARATFAAGGVRDFEADLQDHLAHGYVYALPCLLLMAKAVLLDDGRAVWLVHHAIGPMTQLCGLMPFPLPWIAFKRRYDNRLRVYPTERLLRMAQIPKPTFTPAPSL